MQGMKIKDGYELKKSGDQYVILYRGTSEDAQLAFALNDTGAFLWKGISEGLTEQDLVAGLVQEYEAEPAEVNLIRTDVEDFLVQLKAMQVVTE